MRFRIFSVVVFFVFVLSFFSFGVEKRALTVDDMHAFKDVRNPIVSPNGKWVAYTVSYYSPEKEKRFSDIFLISIDGRYKRQLTAHPAVESGISWSPDSRKIAFSAKRENKTNQVYIIDIHGGEAKRLTNLDTGAENPVWSPDGQWIAFDSSLGEIYSKEMKKELGDVRFITHLRYYHVRNWDDGKRRRIFIVPANGSQKPVQLTRGECSDEGDNSMCWSPDSKEIAFVSNRDKEWWNSIDTNIYTVTVPGGEMKRLTGNRGPDHSPAYAPDGKSIAFRSIFTYNYESENYKVVVAGRNGENPKTLTEKLDRSIRSFKWTPDGKKILFLFGSEGANNIKSVSPNGGPLTDVTTGNHSIRDMDITPDGKTLILLKGDGTHPEELFAFKKNNYKKLTEVNDRELDLFHVQPLEEVWATGVDGAKVQGWVIKPVGFKEGKKYPMILFIHGGPHGMSSVSFQFQFQLCAANGYVVVYSNPRASLGYGETFSRQVWEDWGGLPYKDLMAIVDEVLKLGFVDEKKLGVTGGSFGGYMTNWIVGQTDRFAAAITVAGLSNLTSFYGTTDEQFFPEAEFKGMPWTNKDIYLKHSPIWYAKNFKTPTLVIHGQYDFRVRVEQAEQMFTALQKQGVPSAYAWFPDEGHGVRKPVHRELYYRMLLDWFDHFIKGKPSTFLGK